MLLQVLNFKSVTVKQMTHPRNLNVFRNKAYQGIYPHTTLFSLQWLKETWHRIDIKNTKIQECKKTNKLSNIRHESKTATFSHQLFKYCQLWYNCWKHTIYGLKFDDFSKSSEYFRDVFRTLSNIFDGLWSKIFQQK